MLLGYDLYGIDMFINRVGDAVGYHTVFCRFIFSSPSSCRHSLLCYRINNSPVFWPSRFAPLVSPPARESFFFVLSTKPPSPRSRHAGSAGKPLSSPVPSARMIPNAACMSGTTSSSSSGLMGWRCGGRLMDSNGRKEPGRFCIEGSPVVVLFVVFVFPVGAVVLEDEGGRQKSSKRSAWWAECMWM